MMGMSALQVAGGPKISITELTEDHIKFTLYDSDLRYVLLSARHSLRRWR